MFIYTAKFNKKKAILAVVILAVILCAIVLIAGRADSAAETAGLTAAVKDNAQRVEFLNSLGWEVEQEPLEEQAVVIPKDFSGIYEEYNELQLSQGFDLTKYKGIEATRYTYKVTNHPSGEDSVVADLIVYKNKVIAGDVQSTALDGFMHGLAFPETA